MAEEEKKEEVPYQFTPEGGAASNSSKGYTGKGVAVYPNGETYDGDYLDGVISDIILAEDGKRQVHLLQRRCVYRLVQG